MLLQMLRNALNTGSQIRNHLEGGSRRIEHQYTHNEKENATGAIDHVDEEYGLFFTKQDCLFTLNVAFKSLRQRIAVRFFPDLMS